MLGRQAHKRPMSSSRPVQRNIPIPSSIVRGKVSNRDIEKIYGTNQGLIASLELKITRMSGYSRVVFVPIVNVFTALTLIILTIIVLEHWKINNLAMYYICISDSSEKRDEYLHDSKPKHNRRSDSLLQWHVKLPHISVR